MIPTVEVTLTSLESSSTSDLRTFHLNKENRRVDVGRASRNPTRNFQPKCDNAAFQCPIMSRQHAQFTASPIHKVCLQYDEAVVLKHLVDSTTGPIHRRLRFDAWHFRGGYQDQSPREAYSQERRYHKIWHLRCKRVCRIRRKETAR